MHPTPLHSALAGEPWEIGRVHEAQRNARVGDDNSSVPSPQGDAAPACISQSLMHHTPLHSALADEPWEIGRV
ncbi:MAG: hypothetical protein K8R36_21775, partial [Planctomycetales bacterium]|nr:hypothetical protein [Planctomycetales bacterium]